MTSSTLGVLLLLECWASLWRRNWWQVLLLTWWKVDTKACLKCMGLEDNPWGRSAASGITLTDLFC